MFCEDLKNFRGDTNVKTRESWFFSSFFSLSARERIITMMRHYAVVYSEQIAFIIKLIDSLTPLLSFVLFLCEDNEDFDADLFRLRVQGVRLY